MNMLRIPRRALAALALSGLAGCSGRSVPPGPTDPDAARGALTKALETWQAGGKAADLAQSSPPVYVQDEDWRAGATLAKFEVAAGPGQPHGPGVKFPVAIEVRDPRGKAARKDVVYEVAVDRVVSVARDDMPTPTKPRSR